MELHSFTTLVWKNNKEPWWLEKQAMSASIN